MLLNEEQVTAILEELASRTLRGGMVWDGDGEKVWVGLLNEVDVELSQTRDGVLTACVKRGERAILGSIHVSPDDMGRCATEVRSLYEAASDAATKSVYAEIMESIKRTGPPNGGASQKPELLGSVPKAQADRVMEQMTGKWSLDDEIRGKEKVLILQDGSYFVEGKKEPSFHLIVLAVNPAITAAEVAKDTPTGRRVQIESLHLAPNAMKGHVKYDRRELAYTRLDK